jgi:hypothetical protein
MATVLGHFITAFEGGPATLSVVLGYYTFKPLLNLWYDVEVGFVQWSLTMCYRYMRREATSVNDEALRLAMALQLSASESDPVRRAYLRRAADDSRANLAFLLINALHDATNESDAQDKYPASHAPLRKRFLPLLSRPRRESFELLQVAEQYVHIVAEALAHQQEIFEEDVRDMWEHTHH